MFATQLGHGLAGGVIQVSRTFVIHCDRKNPAIGHRVQILDQAFTLFLGSVSVKPKRSRESEDVDSLGSSLKKTVTPVLAAKILSIDLESYKQRSVFKEQARLALWLAIQWQRSLDLGCRISHMLGVQAFHAPFFLGAVAHASWEGLALGDNQDT